MPVNRRLVEIDKGRAERRKILLRKCGLVGGGDSAAMDVDDQGEPEDVIRAKEREEIEGILVPAGAVLYAIAGATSDFGSCTTPQIEFGVGFDNRKEMSF
ncbi:hypothetical protein BDZ89DRAFT_1128248 [Hymenopellis radicata]|nr:hypothetical protein BDZ89DRAFT_1128248 [Hymenopellis radicata]